MAHKETDVLIIGGGVTGTAIARELSKYAVSVMLIEKEVDLAFGTSKANSGIVHSGVHDRPGTLKARLCVEGNRLYPQMAQELDFLYKNNGAVVVARQEDEIPALKRLVDQGRQNGVTGVRLIGRDDLLTLEPHLSPELAGAIEIPSGGIVIPFDLVYALAENAVANGAEIMLGTAVTAITEEDGAFTVQATKVATVATQATQAAQTASAAYASQAVQKTVTVRSKYIINAAGLHAGKVAGMIGDDSISIRPRKGEEYLLDRRLAGFIKRTIFPLPTPVSKGILIIPTVEGNIMLGPTAHSTDSFDDFSTTATGWREVFDYVRQLAPELKASDLITSFAGLRAASNHDDFIIGPSAVSPRFIHAAGMESPGLTAAPAAARLICDHLKEAGLRLLPKSNFIPVRKVVRIRDLSAAEQAQLMQQDAAYSKIVCRCEYVSEGEIRDAIRRGATTLDGVKLRTRSGMGRCQGGFCTPKIIGILSRELGVPPEQITKRGPGSPLLAGRLRSAGSGGGAHGAHGVSDASGMHGEYDAAAAEEDGADA